MIVHTCDSVTRLDYQVAKRTVIVTGSHGGIYPATIVARLGARGAVFNDASAGKERAGIMGLKLLDDLKIPAAAVGHQTAEIGNGQSTLSGIITVVNESAAMLGCKPGLIGSHAATLFSSHPPFEGNLPSEREADSSLTYAGVDVRLLDSASLVTSGHEAAVVVTGSHGGLVGGVPTTALKYRTAGAVFNDAGRGPKGWGVSRLPVLASWGVPAVTVDAASARIGDGVSTWNDGVISVVNRPAARLAVSVGDSVRDFVKAIAQKGNSRFETPGMAPWDHNLD